MEVGMISIPLATFMSLTSEKGALEQKVKDLEAKILEMTLNPPRKPRSKAPPKELTPEEEAERKAKRSERAKKAAATRKANKEAEAEAARVAAEEELFEKFRNQMLLEAAPPLEENEI